MSNVLEDFGKILITEIRDKTIEDIDNCTTGKFRSERAIKIENIYKKLTNENKEFVDYLITEVVDNCIHNFLDMFEQNEDIKIKLNGINLVEVSDGLSGELYSEDGWIHKFSKERYNDK